SVLYVNNLFYMYYTGAAPGFQGDGYSWQIEYAASSDGVNWNKQGIAFKADSITWENGRVQAPSRPVCFNGKYYMFYTGGPRKPKNLIYTGYAISSDLIHWEKYPDIIPQNIDRANDIFIYEEDSTFYMFYTTYTQGEPVFFRMSKDLKNWSEPQATGAGGEGVVVWKEKDKYYMIGCLGYSGKGEAYHFYSSDCLKDFKYHGVLEMDVPSWASDAFGHGDIIRVGNEMWLYFQGTNNGGKTFKIGLAKISLDSL
ncbi:MAG: hypothetical protein IH594_08005, partial [Bacteroidales bacterium]|nr:hypothetical protein [Bacteroidales bacterium]